MKPRASCAPFAGAEAVLLVIAHPDDESMFFVPSILHLQKSRGILHVLCLSTGNYYGQGGIRVKELKATCSFLGVPQERVHVVDHPQLQDDPHAVWPLEVIQDETRRVLSSIHEPTVAGILTFDDYGVSGHPNHRAVSQACKGLVASSRCSKGGRNGDEPIPLRLWELCSVSIARKYTGLLDVLWSMVEVCVAPYDEKLSLIVSPGLWWRSYGAMRLHASQFVWYRMLFVLFSRYAYMNTMREWRFT